MLHPRATRRATIACLATLVLPIAVASGAAAQSATRLRGTIERVDPAGITVATREGSSVAAALPDPLRVSTVVRASLADLKPGVFVGTAGVPMPDGTQRALAITLLPEASRATGGFFSAWDLVPESTMTNATIAEAASRVEGETLRVTYKDGEKTILVGPETPVVALRPASRDDLKPGAKVVVFATKRDDGSLAAGNVVVGRDGVDPPM